VYINVDLPVANCLRCLHGATTFSIMTLGKTTLGVMAKL
jgi:hypothetical protein